LRDSHPRTSLPSQCCARHTRRLRWGALQRGSNLMKGSTLPSDKLSVVVRVDVDGEQIQIAATGRVTALSLQGLYPVVQRTKSLGGGLGVEMDLTEATVDADALQQLQVFAELHEVPVRFQNNNVTALPTREFQTASRAA